MKILNLGSMNVDNVYKVDEFLLPGETKLSQGLNLFCGGKGLNQSIAAARAGNEVWHAGLVGEDGGMLLDKLAENGVNTSLIRQVPGKGGHTVIQVNRQGQNCILLYGGTNRMLTREIIDDIFDTFGPEGAVLLQNEINLLPYVMETAHRRGLPIFFNAAPMDEQVHQCDLSLVDWLIVNEVEGQQLAGDCPEEDILPVLSQKYPGMSILLTLGSRGAACLHRGEKHTIGVCSVKPVDTTAAGDTFSGYFMYGVLKGLAIPDCLRLATAASALCVGRAGAADSVPLKAEVDQVLAQGTLEVPQAREEG
mgnify:CR=1 FL=1